MQKQLSVAFWVTLFILSGWGLLHAWAPRQDDFANPGLYNLFNSWRQQGLFAPDAPASVLSPQKVEVTFSNRFVWQARVAYMFSNGKVVALREFVNNLPAGFSGQAWLEQLAYCLNAQNSNYAWQMLQQANVSLNFAGQQGKTALDVLFKLRQDERLGYNVVSVDPTNRTWVINTNIGDISLTVPASGLVSQPTTSWATGVTPVTRQPKASTVDISLENAYPNLPYKHPEIAPPAGLLPSGQSLFKTLSNPDPAWKLDTLTPLESYLFAGLQRPLRKKVLNNSITNVQSFLQAQYPSRRLNRVNGTWVINGDSLEHCYNRLEIWCEQGHDGYYFYPAENYTYNAQLQALVLPDGEQISCRGISQNQALAAAPVVLGLLYQHRALGTDLFDIIYRPFSLEATLVLKGKNRNVLQYRNYDTLIFHLHNWWRGNTVYASVPRLQKIDGHLELRLYLIVKGSVTDRAEIRLRLSDKLLPDTAMLILAPGTDN